MVLKLLVFFFTFSLSQEVGDECTLYNGEIGFLECNLACYPIALLENIGNGSCDDGIDCCELNCPEFDCDGGDCIGTYYESDCELFEQCSDGDINNDNEINVQDILLIVNSNPYKSTLLFYQVHKLWFHLHFQYRKSHLNQYYYQTQKLVEKL